MNAADVCKEPVKELTFLLLKEKYDIEEEISCLLSLRSFRLVLQEITDLTCSMIMGYGHDDPCMLHTLLLLLCLK